jgi:hypothetical protein
MHLMGGEVFVPNRRKGTASHMKGQVCPRYAALRERPKKILVKV